MKLYVLIPIAVVFLAIPTLLAQTPGTLDLSFGEHGKTQIPAGTANAFSRAVQLQPDGKIVLACVANNGHSTDFTLVRFNENGEPDPAFGSQGIIMTDVDSLTDIAEALGIDALHRLIVGGSVDSGNGFHFAVGRYGSDGQLDDSFSEDGLVTIPVGITGFCQSMIIQPDFKIVLGGYAFNPLTQTNEFVLVRFDPDGRPDSTWGGDGIVKTNFGIGAAVGHAMARQSDGKILLAGEVLNESTFLWEIAIARYLEDGRLDESWGDGGIVLTPVADINPTINAIAIQDDERILVGGFAGTAPSNNQWIMARIDPHGQPDASFGSDGIMLGTFGFQNNQIQDIAIQPDGHIIIAGHTLVGQADHFALARLKSDGLTDITFGDGGHVITDMGLHDGISAIALQPDGKLVVAGESFDGNRFNIATARYETGLTTHLVEPDFTLTSASIYPNPVDENLNLSFQLKHEADVRIILFDLKGKELEVIAQVQNMPAGEHHASYTVPGFLPSGVYVISIIAGDEGVSLKMVRE